MISAGSPGARCKTMKMMIETPSSTGTSSSRRRTTYRLTAWRTSLQRDRLDAEVEARVELEPLDPFGMGGGLDLVVDEDPRRIVDENALGFAIERGALALVGRQPCLVQELVEALVLVERAIRAGRRPLARVEQRVHHHVGILVARHPREREELLLLRPELREIRAPLHGLQRDRDADGP